MSKVTSIWHATRSRRDASELELAEKVVVLGAGALALVHLDQHTRLVVGVGGEGLGLLGWHGGVTWDQGGHHTTGGLETEGQRGDIEQEEVGVAGGATGEHTGLDGGTVGHSLIGVDRLVRLLAIEEARHELVHLRDTGGATYHDHLVHGALVDLGVAEHLLHWLEGAAEEVGAQILEASAGDARVEVNTLEERVDLNVGRSGRGELTLGTLAGGAETTHGTGVAGHVLLVLALELLGEVYHQRWPSPRRCRRRWSGGTHRRCHHPGRR